VQDVAEILLANGIGAVPVVGKDGELAGIISQADLIRRSEIDTERRRPRWLALLIGNQPLAAEFVKSNARSSLGRRRVAEVDCVVVGAAVHLVSGATANAELKFHPDQSMGPINER
jgi:hypothetical protein